MGVFKVRVIPNAKCYIFAAMIYVSPRVLAYWSLAAICIIWGTTYTAIKIGILYFPPYLMVGIRQTSAGLLLMSVAAAMGAWRYLPGRRYIGLQAITGVFTITGGNGFITWGMQYVSSGIASIIGALTPVLVVLISLFWHGSEPMTRRQIAGVALGFVGIGFVFSEGWRDFLNPQYALGIFGCFASCFTWSLGMVMSKRFNSAEVPPMLNAGIQIFFGGLGGFVLSVFFDKHHNIQHTWEGWLAITYLFVFGSALAFSLYMIVLKYLPATVASIYTYINPVVAILLGWLVLHEPLHYTEWIGMVITLIGVWLVTRSD